MLKSKVKSSFFFFQFQKIRGMLEPFAKVFKIHQKVSAAILGSLNFSARGSRYLNLEEFTAFDISIVITFSIL